MTSKPRIDKWNTAVEMMVAAAYVALWAGWVVLFISFIRAILN